jgi:hypothetical protein
VEIQLDAYQFKTQTRQMLWGSSFTGYFPTTFALGFVQVGIRIMDSLKPSLIFGVYHIRDL